MGMRMPGWYDIASLEDINQREDEPGLVESKRRARCAALVLGLGWTAGGRRAGERASCLPRAGGVAAACCL
jgi:hypothetical protein